MIAGYAASMESELRSKGLRITPQRHAVLSYLEKTEGHPSVEEVAESIQRDMPSVALSTVYNTLRELSDLGLVQTINGDGPTRYDPMPGAHAHLICSECGKIINVPLPKNTKDKLTNCATKCDCSLNSYHISIDGLCPDCLASQE